MLMVFNDNISVTSLWSVLLVELPGETRTKNAHMCGITTGVIFLFVVVVY
jgi:hypothetical protein